MNSAKLDEAWDKILERLPEKSLKKLMALPEDEISEVTIYQILTESGVNFDDILSKKEIYGTAQ